MTPAKKWKYAAIRGLRAQMDEAIDAGARDLLKYARNADITFEDCRAAWSARFGVWHAIDDTDMSDEEELRAIRTIVSRDRAATLEILKTDVVTWNYRIMYSIGKYADEDLIRDLIINEEPTYNSQFGMIVSGALIAHRLNLARDLIKYIKDEWLEFGDMDLIARRALYAGKPEMFELICDGEKVETTEYVNLAARGGSIGAFITAKEHCTNWIKDIENILVCAILSGNIEIVEEIRERDELKKLKYQYKALGRQDPQYMNINFNFEYPLGSMKRFAYLAARKGNRAMCDYILSWSRATGQFDAAACEMMNGAISRDNYWIVAMVCDHMSARYGAYAEFKGEISECKGCCAYVWP